MHLETLNLTVLNEEIAELVFGHIIRETLHIEIASLLRAFVLDGFTEAFGLTVSFFKCFFDIKLFVVWQNYSVNRRLSVKFGDSLLSAARSILAVLLVLRVEANEGVGSLLVDHKLYTLDTAKLAKEILDVCLSVVVREVFGVDVVVNFSEFTLVTGVIQDDLEGVCVTLGFQSSLGACGVLEADKAVTTRLVITVQGNLQGLDVTLA